MTGTGDGQWLSSMGSPPAWPGGRAQDGQTSRPYELEVDVHSMPPRDLHPIGPVVLQKANYSQGLQESPEGCGCGEN
jgi:hypothetical protein